MKELIEEFETLKDIIKDINNRGQEEKKKTLQIIDSLLEKYENEIDKI